MIPEGIQEHKKPSPKPGPKVVRDPEGLRTRGEESSDGGVVRVEANLNDIRGSAGWQWSILRRREREGRRGDEEPKRMQDR